MSWEASREKLQEQKAKLEYQLSLIARKSPTNPEDWEVKAPDLQPMVSDQSEMADVFEELENQAGLEYQLEERLKKVNAALKRIEDGSYGICTKGGEKIEAERLEANLLAETCISHAKKA